jgi:hypothetical protein
MAWRFTPTSASTVPALGSFVVAMTSPMRFPRRQKCISTSTDPSAPAPPATSDYQLTRQIRAQSGLNEFGAAPNGSAGTSNQASSVRAYDAFLRPPRGTSGPDGRPTASSSGPLTSGVPRKSRKPHRFVQKIQKDVGSGPVAVTTFFDGAFGQWDKEDGREAIAHFATFGDILQEIPSFREVTLSPVGTNEACVHNVPARQSSLCLPRAAAQGSTPNEAARAAPDRLP